MKEIVVRTLTVRSLLHHLSEGRFAIPEVQREFVWNGRKACALLDSIYRNMPIGTLLVWDTHRRNRDLLRRTLNVLPEYNSANRNIWFLIDGQQRLSVIFQVQKGDRITNERGVEVDFSRVCLDLTANNDEPQFAYRRAEAGRFVPLSSVLAPNWRRRTRGLAKWKRGKAERCRRELLKYQLPVVFGQTEDVEEVRESFIRINSLGLAVGAADRAFARAVDVNLRRRAQDALMRLGPEFDRLSRMTVLLSFALLLGERDVGARAINRAIDRIGENLKRKGDEKKFVREWSRFEGALQKAVDYLRANFAVSNRGMLPSENMLATLTLFFSWNGGQPNASQRREIRKWFWATAVGQRYAGRGYRDNIMADVRFFEGLARRKRARFVFADKVFKSDVRKADYARRSGLTAGFYCLLALREPRYLDNGEPIPLNGVAQANAKHKHHIYPVALMRKQGLSRNEYNGICNICLIVAQDHGPIGQKRPSTYLAEYRKRKHFARCMRSHLIPHHRDSGLWSRDVRRGFRRLVRERLEVLCAAFEKQAGMRLFQEG